MKKSIATKILSVTTSVALLATSFTGPAGAAMPAAAAAPDFVRALTPAENLGNVVSSYGASGATAPRLIIIADLHGHVDVQHNIMGMLDSYVNKLRAGNNQKVPLFIEGGWTSNLQEPLRQVKNPKTRDIMNEYLLRKSELAAGQAFSEWRKGKNEVTVTGVENKDLYEANRQRFAESYPLRKAVLQAIARQESAMNTLGDYIQPKAYSKLQALRQGYLKGTVSTEEYTAALLHDAERTGLQSQFMSVLRNPQSVNEGRLDAILSYTHQQVLERLAEDRPFSSYIRPQIKNENQVRINLAKADGSMDLLKRVLGDQLTPEEVPLAIAQINRLAEVAQMLLADQKVNFNITEALHKSLDFYAYAFLRDKALVKNALTSLEKDPTHPATGILIAGGFHTGNMADYLKEQRIPYLVVNPVVSRDISTEEQLNYIKRICDDHITKDEVIFDMHRPWGQKLTNNPLPVPVSTLGGPAASPATPDIASAEEGIEGSDKGSAKWNGAIAGAVAVAGAISVSEGAAVDQVHLDLLNKIAEGDVEAKIDEAGLVLQRDASGLLKPADQETKQTKVVSDLVNEVATALGQNAVHLKTLVIQPTVDGQDTRVVWKGDTALVLVKKSEYNDLVEAGEIKKSGDELGHYEAAAVKMIHEILHPMVAELRAAMPEAGKPTNQAKEKDRVAREQFTQALAFAMRAGMIEASNHSTSFSLGTKVSKATIEDLFNKTGETFTADEIEKVRTGIENLNPDEELTTANLAIAIARMIDPEVALNSPKVKALIDSLSVEHPEVPRQIIDNAAEEYLSGWAALKGANPEDADKLKQKVEGDTKTFEEQQRPA